MDRPKLMRSAVLAMVLLWQCLANFLGPAEASFSQACKHFSSTDKVRQISVLAAALPALIEIKPFDKPLKIEGSKIPSFREILLCSIFASLLLLYCPTKNLKFRAPVNRGYWLLFRSLKL